MFKFMSKLSIVRKWNFYRSFQSWMPGMVITILYPLGAIRRTNAMLVNYYYYLFYYIINPPNMNIIFILFVYFLTIFFALLRNCRYKKIAKRFPNILAPGNTFPAKTRETRTTVFRGAKLHYELVCPSLTQSRVWF